MEEVFVYGRICGNNGRPRGVVFLGYSLLVRRNDPEAIQIILSFYLW